MNKLNNKGFAIASILYSVMVLFLMLLLSILGILGSRKATLDKNKKDIINSLNQAYVVNRFTFEHKDITIVNTGNLDDITYALMDGVKAIDAEGNEISKEFIRYDLNINNIENKAYNVTYTANSNGQTIVGTRLITFTPTTNITTFAYKGSPEEFTPDYNGAYKIELWGASGAILWDGIAGLGGYTSGNMNFTTNDKLYFVVGGKGNGAVGGYNGGGPGGGGAGGGATHVTLNSNRGVLANYASFKSEILMVSGGGGGAERQTGGAGGNLVGQTGFIGTSTSHLRFGTGGSQTEGGKGVAATDYPATENIDGSFGLGGSGKATGDNGPGGGGGFYGGGATTLAGGAGGGSSYIAGYYDKSITSYNMNNPVMYAGNEVMPTHDGTSTMVGNSGNGYAKISLIYYY